MPALTTLPRLSAFQEKAQADLIEEMMRLPFTPKVRDAVYDGFADGYRAAQRDLLAAGVLVLDPDHRHDTKGEDEGECPDCSSAREIITAATARIDAAKKARR